MSAPSANLFILKGNAFSCLRVVGRATFSSGIDFQNVVERLLRQGCRYFVLDLADCILMDSTFLGLLAGYGVKLGGDAERGGGAIELLNPNPRVVELLDNLGVVHLFKIAQRSPDLAPSAEASPCESANPTKREITKACLEAHETLMALNPENAVRFKDVARFLAEDLKQQSS
jgi:anti-sigma B factor antagonist